MPAEQLSAGGGGNATKTGLSTPDQGARLREDEHTRVRQWRCDELMRAGMEPVEAAQRSDDAWALDLVRRGCPLGLIGHILDD